MNIVYTDHGFGDVEIERRIIEEAGGTLTVEQCKTAGDVIAASGTADVLLVQWAPVTKAVIESLPRLKLIVRIGIGTDNVDLVAARAAGIDVCNVPDYCTDEVADHSMALALALTRQLVQTDERTRNGTWQITTPRPITSFSDQFFVTIGFGRIARAVLSRAKSFGFKLAAVDPIVPESNFANAGVKRLSVEDAFQLADVLSLHCGLYDETLHLVNEDRLTTMKNSAVVVNTSRGGLIDADALAAALASGQIGGAGLDVFEGEPLDDSSPLRSAPNTILTSHVAWYSTNSIVRLRELAAEEIARHLRGEPPKNVVN